MIRALPFARGIAKTYPNARMALVLRDPIDVACSQDISAWPLELSRFFDQPDLVSDFPELNCFHLREARTSFEVGIAHWVIENYVALSQSEKLQKSRANIGIFTYDALKQSSYQMREFMTFLGVTDIEVVLFGLHRPSRVARYKVGSNKTWSSRTTYSPTNQELKYAARTLRLFKMDKFLNDKNRAAICTSLVGI